MNLRSKYASYTFGPLVFSGGVAQTKDASIIQKITASPDFGPGRDFWEDFPPPPAAVAEAEKNAGADDEADEAEKKKPNGRNK